MPSDFDHSIPGEDTVDRLMARRDLTRISIPGGGEAYTGPGATRALKAMNANAMTVDRSIIVPEDFDSSNPEHMALYAHEQYHVTEGTGEGGAHHIHDAEEVAARSVQRMVLHRMTGGTEGGYQPGSGSGSAQPGQTPDQGGRGTAEFNPGTLENNDNNERDADSSRGYKRLLAQGMSHLDVADKLARDCIAVLDAQKQGGFDRQADKKGNF